MWWQDKLKLAPGDTLRKLPGARVGEVEFDQYAWLDAAGNERGRVRYREAALPLHMPSMCYILQTAASGEVVVELNLVFDWD